MKIIFELAKRLGLRDLFRDDDIEAGVNYQVAPSKVTCCSTPPPIETLTSIGGGLF